MSQILRHEYLEKIKQKPVKQLFMEIIMILDKVGEVKVQGDFLTILSSDEAIGKKDKAKSNFSMIDFLRGMGLYLLDTYLIVLMAV
jgi:hypothetical protein